MKKITSYLLITILIASFTTNAQIRLTETTLDTATLISELDVPWEIQWGPDGMIWTTERYGRISRIHPESGAQDVILDISGLVYQSGESGLLGMALHPDFEEEPYVYMAYTHRPAGQILEKIVRYRYQDGTLSDEFVLLDNIQGNTTHDGCRLIILPDNTLLFSTGDAQNQAAPQDTSHLSGKFLRLNLDGSIPADNPFPGNPVFSFGHRNPQGLLMAPNGIIYSSEHGPTTDDEFNIIEAGQNYGWPDVHGYCNLPDEITFCNEHNVVEPLTAWTPTIATSDIVYYTHEAIPEWTNHILLTTLKNRRLYVLELNDDGTSVTGEEQYFFNFWGRLRDVLEGPNGEIYLATNGPNGGSPAFTHKIVKVWNPDYVSIQAQQNTNKSPVSIFPNPANDKLRVYVDHEIIGQQLNIYSTSGRLILSQRIDSTLTTVSLKELSQGMFIVSLSDGDTVIFSEKLFITRD